MTKIIAAKPADDNVVQRIAVVTINNNTQEFVINNPSDVEFGEVEMNLNDSVEIEFTDSSEDGVVISHTIKFIVDREFTEIILPE